MKYREGKGRKTKHRAEYSASGENDCLADRITGAIYAGIRKVGKISVIPYLFEQYLILSLDFRWVSVFGCVPTFDVYIDKNGHLVIISQEVCLK